MSNATQQSQEAKGGRKTEGVGRDRRTSGTRRSGGRASAFLAAHQWPSEIDKEVGTTPVRLRPPTEDPWKLLIVTDDHPLIVRHKSPDGEPHETTLKPFYDIAIPAGSTDVEIHAPDEPTQVTSKLYQDDTSKVLMNVKGDEINTSKRAVRNRQACKRRYARDRDKELAEGRAKRAKLKAINDAAKAMRPLDETR